MGHLTGFFLSAGAPEGGTTLRCAMCQARPKPCLRLILPQKQLLCPLCSFSETGQSAVGRSRPEQCGVRSP